MNPEGPPATVRLARQARDSYQNANMCSQPKVMELKRRWGRPRHWLARVAALVAAWSALNGSARAEIQFDVFIGYDDRVREGTWFPVAFEILNDGPTFTGTVVFSPEIGFDTQQRRFDIELPTGTRKREIIPVFSSSGRYGRFDARLFGLDGKLVAERTGLQPKDTAAHVPVLGALPRTFGGLPTLPDMRNRAPELLPGVARLQAEYLPANPLALEGLSAWYLNSERAADLRPDQVDAMLAWVHGGGHLIVGMEKAADANASAWMSAVLPFAPEEIGQVAIGSRLDDWVRTGGQAVESMLLPSGRPEVARRHGLSRNAVTLASGTPADPFLNIKEDASLSAAELPVVRGKALQGARVLLEVEGTPLIVSTTRGRGAVTVLAFSPEREPFRSWENRDWFWAKLIAVPPELLIDTDIARWGGTSIDGLFGAMLDSRQVRKLPIAALLVLLVVYLGVIGPFDQWVLKRLGKQMWTWVTFPVYVVLFSALIYFIGYRLRAGDLEWNELQVVDQLPRSEGATFRGRTWVSIYSPANARYRLASEQAFSTIRAELQRGGPNRGEGGRLDVRYPGEGFSADAFVPVWVSQLYESDWVQAGPQLIGGQVTRSADKLRIALENRSNLRFTQISIAFGNRLHEVGALEAGQRLEMDLPREGGTTLEAILGQWPHALAKVRQRGMAFGGEASGQWTRDLTGVVLASFVDGQVNHVFDPGGESFSTPAGFDLGNVLQRGEAVLFGWAPNQGWAAPIHRFSPRRQQRDTVVRLTLEVTPST
jgi:hypothetical protein